MGYITEETMRQWENTQSLDDHTCHQFPGSPDAYARRLRWQSQEQAEQEERDQLAELFQSWKDERQERVQALKHRRAIYGIPRYNQYGGLA